MANKVEISAGLKRNLKNGKEYDNLIPSVKCERTNLGEGDTFNTVNWMKDWIEKYSFQTAKLSPKLQGRSLEETVKNIYQFLYDHVQYTADGPLQQLRSPACTWTQRKEGVDCKSYSVFASSILSNLGIKHFIRQIRQSYFYPDEFTHVYIVVPINQTVSNYQKNTPTYVLDATKHQNTESNYIEKVDVQMVNLKHIGLNAPAVTQDVRTQNITKNFEAFSIHLLQNGIPLSIVNSMRERVSNFTNSGKDPSFKIVDKGIIIEGQLFVLNFKPTENQEQGLGVLITGAAAVAGGKALLKMLPPDFLANTFGAIFSNGFDLSCWGSATNPTKAAKSITDIWMPYIEAQFAIIENPTNNDALIKAINDLFRFSNVGYGIYNKIANMSKYAKCSRKGWQVQADFLNPIRTQMKLALDKLSKEYNVSTSTKSITGLQEFNYSGGKVTIGGTKDGPFNGVPYIISIGAAKNQQPANNTTANINPNNTPTNSNTGLIMGGVALAALPLLFFMKKSPVRKNKKR